MARGGTYAELYAVQAAAYRRQGVHKIVEVECVAGSYRLKELFEWGGIRPTRQDQAIIRQDRDTGSSAFLLA